MALAAPVIDLDGVERTFPGSPPVRALRPCALRVFPGDYLTIVGPSGSGKSTLLNLLGLLDRPTSGSYLLEGVDTSTLTEDQRTALRGRRLGFVFQSFHLVDHRTATENVMLGLLYRNLPARERRDRARSALEQVGLERRLDALPTTMSGGERQRVAIARALAGHPAVLLCDEPTGNLDQRVGAEVASLFEKLNAETGVTLVVVTHDPIMARRARRNIKLVDGGVVHDGAPLEGY